MLATVTNRARSGRTFAVLTGRHTLAPGQAADLDLVPGNLVHAAWVAAGHVEIVEHVDPEQFGPPELYGPPEPPETVTPVTDPAPEQEPAEPQDAEQFGPPAPPPPAQEADNVPKRRGRPPNQR